jgi:MFS transporter, DHA1 family, inner membrane transport protein
MTYNRQEKSLLATLAGAKFTHILDFMVMMPLGPLLMQKMDISAQQFGFLVASYTISAGVAVLLSALFIDKLPRRKSLLFIYLGFILGTLVCGISNSYFSLMLARMLTGVFGGVLNALILSTVGDSFPIEKRAGAMGVVLTSFSAAAAFGVPFGIYLASLGDWNWPFFVIVVLALPLWFGMYYFVPSGEKTVEQKVAVKEAFFEVFLRVLRNPNQLSALGMSLALVLGQFMIIPYISPYMVGNIGFSQMQLVYIYLCGGLSTLVTGPIIGRFADKYGHKRLFLLFAAFSIIPLMLVTHLPKVALPFALVASTLFFIFISGRTIPSSTMVISSVETRFRAGFVSINTAMQQFAAGLAATISGSVVTEIVVENAAVKAISGYPIVGYMAVGLTLVAMFLGSRLKAVK